MIGKIKLFETSEHAWYDLVSEQGKLTEVVESYLVFTLTRHMHNIPDYVLALEWLDLQQFPEAYRLENLRDFADHCLLLAGLFPDYVQKHHVAERYCQSLGQSAYGQLAILHANRSHPEQSGMYAMVQKEFSNMVAVMHAIRESKQA